MDIKKILVIQHKLLPMPLDFVPQHIENFYTNHFLGLRIFFIFNSSTYSIY